MMGLLLALLALVGQLAAVTPRPSDAAFVSCGPGSVVGLQAGGHDDGGAVAGIPLALLAEAGVVPLLSEGAVVGGTGFGRVDRVRAPWSGGGTVTARTWPPPRGPPIAV